ncbi:MULTISPECIES: hypothetical protein [Gammaproteobacteria]|uniref:hypothetical protein n=1 Tax=Gammaproteobacteria TaxID=1236 RepID=UPI000DD049D9|nr:MULTISPECIES: hypothetical protein [Gammaproteobacteria]RTE86091.1 hypothetical protein DQX04_05835 [Aliidiomarina sp. B3213]TCZ91445.1 hypothetical protein EYQ95_05845 [Lysobacter sp. N42]
MSKNYRILLIIAFAIVSSGCSSLPFGDNSNTQQTSREEITTIGLQNDRYAYGHGFGETRERALQAARDELAEMILVNVRTETRQDLREAEDQEITSEFVASSFSWSNVELENLQVDFEQRNRNDGTWYVRLRIERSGVTALTQKARRKAPSLNAVYYIEQADSTQPAQRLARAIDGYNIAHRDGVLAESFITQNGSQATFETYFAEVSEASVRALKALPIVHEDGKQIAIALIHESTATPQQLAKIYLRVNGQETELSTDSRGMTAWLPISNLGNSFSLVARRGDITISGSRIERFQEVDRYTTQAVTNAEEALVYFYLDPVDANVRIGSESLGSPQTHPLESGRLYGLTIRSERYRDRNETLNIPRGAAFAYVNAELEARQYGSLALAVENREGVFEIRRDSDNWIQSRGNTYDRELAEAGSYAIRVGRRGEKGFDPDFQIQQDLIELQNEQRYSRVYEAPAYREPYSYGWRVALYTLRGNGEPSSTYRIPMSSNLREGTDGHYQEFQEAAYGGNIDYWGSSDDFVINVQRYFDTLNFTVQGSAGRRTHAFDVYQVDRGSFINYWDLETVELDTAHISIGAGFWKSFYSDRVITSLTINQAYDFSSWDLAETIEIDGDFSSDTRTYISGSDSSRNSYLYAEANAHFNLGGFGFTASVIVPAEQMEPIIQLGFAFSFFDSGYRRPAMVDVSR